MDNIIPTTEKWFGYHCQNPCCGRYWEDPEKYIFPECPWCASQPLEKIDLKQRKVEKKSMVEEIDDEHEHHQITQCGKSQKGKKKKKNGK